MARHLKISVLFAALVTNISPTQTCIITRSYVLCNEVSIDILEAGKYPMNTTTIQAIHFNSNNLTHLNKDVFNGIPSLKFIVIIHNLIRTLETELFWNLKELIHLDLTDNQIKYITNILFISQTKLKNLLLGYNQIETLDSRVFVPLNSLSSLDLIHNPFICNCELKEVVIWCVERGLAVNTTCKNGTSWSVLDITDMCEITELHLTVMHTSYENVTTDTPSENLTKYHTSRPFTIQEILTVVGITVVLIVCIIIGLYFWKRSEMFCFARDDRARDVGRTETEDCRNEFVSSKRHQYSRESISGTTLYEQDLDPSPECVVLRRSSETDSVYLNPSKLIDKEYTTSELPIPDLAAYSEPFHSNDSPPPVYAVPFNKDEEKYFWIENDMYSVHKVDDGKIKYTKANTTSKLI